MNNKQDSDFIQNHFRIKKLGDKYLLTTDHNSFIFLSEKQVTMLKRNRLNSNLFKLFEEKGIIITKRNVNKIVEEYKKKYSFLNQGTSLHIVVPTLRCDMNCVYCHASSKPENAKGYDMGKPTAKKIVDLIFQSPSHGIAIEFQGGEPLLNFDIVKFIIEYAEELNKEYHKDLSFALVTNLTQMDDEKLDFLANKKVSICTSLDGPKLLHDKNRINKTCSNHEQLKSWVKKIRDVYDRKNVGYKVNALLTVTKESLNYPKQIIDEYVNFSFNDIHLRFLNRIGCASSIWASIGYSAEEFVDFWKKAVDYIIELNKEGKIIRERIVTIILQKALFNFEPNYLELRSPCGAAIGQLLYNYDGKIYSCDEGRMLGEDLFLLGDAKKTKSYTELISSPNVCSLVLSSLNDPFCDSCVYKPYCGICPVCSYVEKGNIVANVTETTRCKIFREQFDYIFKKLQEYEFIEIFTRWISNSNV